MYIADRLFLSPLSGLSLPLAGRSVLLYASARALFLILWSSWTDQTFLIKSHQIHPPRFFQSLQNQIIVGIIYVYMINL